MTAERTYRWLLTCYPWEHRRQYEDEMLGVLLADSEGRGRPGVRDVLDLLAGAVRARVKHLGTGLSDERWRDANAAFSLLASLVMLTYAARNVILVHGFAGGFATVETAGPIWNYLLVGAWQSWDVWPRLIVWVLVVLATVTGLRRIAAGLGWAAVVLEVLIAFGGFALSDIYSATQLWPLGLTVVAAAALTFRGPRSGRAVLGRRRTAMLAAAALLGVAGAATGIAAMRDGPELSVAWWFARTVHPAEAVLTGVGLLLGVLCLLSMPATLRRRVVALLTPTAATVLVTRFALYDVDQFGYPFGVYTTPTAAQWLALVGIPLLTFALAVVVVHRRDRTQHLLTLGLEADRQR